MLYLIIALVLILLIFLVLCCRIYRYVFYTPTKTQNDDYAFPKNEQTLPRYHQWVKDIRDLNERPFEDVYMTSRDGLKLHARLFVTKENAPLAICFHGYRGTPARNFVGGPPMLFTEGYNVLLPEARGHGTSEGHTVTFGVMEQYDCFDWIVFAAEKFGTNVPILLIGLSMGATTTLLASGMDLPGSVRGIIADSPYRDPISILLNAAAEMHLPLGLSRFFLETSAFMFGHFRMRGADATEAVRKARIPILLIHGLKDTFVPPENSEELVGLNPSMIRREVFPEAGHGMSYIVDPERYGQLLHDFTEQVIRA